MKAVVAKLASIAPELPVRNLEHALAFYTRQLGFEVAARMPDGDYAIVERDGVAIHLFEDKTGSLTPVGVHIFTADLEELCRELEERGAHLVQKIQRKPWGNREFRLKDESGNDLKFTEPQWDD
jgi:uncharacterized glyoxalase superfamily protein PhnB